MLTICFTSVNSQNKPSAELGAEGAARIKIKPDLAEFTLAIEKKDSVEKNAIKNLNVAVDQLVNSLYKVGFKNDAVKISDYDIESSTDNDALKPIYTASNVLKIEFPIDNKLIDAFYTEIQHAGIEDLNVSFETDLSNSLEKATRVKLVQLAIEDAKSNAIIISKALEIKLGKVKQVHKYNERAFEVDKIEMMKFAPPKVIYDEEIKSKTSFDKFQVEKMVLDEKITVVYEIIN